MNKFNKDNNTDDSDIIKAVVTSITYDGKYVDLPTNNENPDFIYPNSHGEIELTQASFGDQYVNSNINTNSEIINVNNNLNQSLNKSIKSSNSNKVSLNENLMSNTQTVKEKIFKRYLSWFYENRGIQVAAFIFACAIITMIVLLISL